MENLPNELKQYNIYMLEYVIDRDDPYEDIRSEEPQRLIYDLNKKLGYKTDEEIYIFRAASRDQVYETIAYNFEHYRPFFFKRNLYLNIFPFSTPVVSPIDKLSRQLHAKIKITALMIKEVLEDPNWVDFGVYINLRQLNKENIIVC